MTQEEQIRLYRLMEKLNWFFHQEMHYLKNPNGASPDVLPIMDSSLHYVQETFAPLRWLTAPARRI